MHAVLCCLLSSRFKVEVEVEVVVAALSHKDWTGLDETRRDCTCTVTPWEDDETSDTSSSIFTALVIFFFLYSLCLFFKSFLKSVFTNLSA